MKSDHLHKLAETLMALALATMVVLVFGNVVLRYAFDSGIAASEELARLSFVWLVFLGAIVALRDHQHLGMDLLVRRLPPPARRLCAVLSQLLMLAGLALLAHGSWQQMLIGWQDRAPVTRIPLAFWQGASLLAAAAMALIVLVDLRKLLRGEFTDEELVMVRESSEEEPR